MLGGIILLAFWVSAAVGQCWGGSCPIAASWRGRSWRASRAIGGTEGHGRGGAVGGRGGRVPQGRECAAEAKGDVVDMFSHVVRDEVEGGGSDIDVVGRSLCGVEPL